MEIKSYRARSMQEALALVRADLGPDAAVLHTREISPAGMRWWGAARQIEVIATPEAENVPSRLPNAAPDPVSAPLMPPADWFRDRLATTAAQGMDLAEVDEPAAEASASFDPGAWPREVAAHFLEMLRSLPPDDRRKVVAAIADVARGSSAGAPPAASGREL